MIVTKQWKNWARNIIFNVNEILYPETVEEVQLAVKTALSRNNNLRVIGSGHSFTALGKTDEILIDLKKLTGIKHLNSTTNEVTAYGGTTLKTLGELLHEHGLAMENLGDIDLQTIAGAISTGTHGTGSDFGIIAAQVSRIVIVNGSGELITFDESKTSDLLDAVRVSLGLLGIIVEVTIKAIPSYILHYKVQKSTLDQVLLNIDSYIKNNRNFEFYAFPYSKFVQIKTMNLSKIPIEKVKIKNRCISNFFNDVILENYSFGLICRVVRLFPLSARMFSRMTANLISTFEKINFSHKVYPTKRLIRFYEMEYSLPVQNVEIVLLEILRGIEEYQFKVNFPVEVRFIKGDNSYLSPAYLEDRCFIAVHMYNGMNHQAYFSYCEKIFLKHKGRPHWGKIHNLNFDTLKNLYPMISEFKKIRDENDPKKIFINDYCKLLFGYDVN
jgi:FAD-linked oxidoreductase